MEFESIMNMAAYYTGDLFEIASFGLAIGFIGVTVLSFLAYGIFKAIALLNVKK